MLSAALAGAAFAAPTIVGDMNCDGVVNEGDLQPFLLAVNDPAGYVATYPACSLNNGDINGDMAVDAQDIPPFFALLRGPVPAPAASAAGLAAGLLTLATIGWAQLRNRTRASRRGQPPA
jgi:hypothetical protein